MTTPRVYIASLADYNAGRLHGKWFNLDRFADSADLYDAVKAEILDTSPEPLAEEWAIHDHEGFGDLHLGEYESLDNILAIAHAIEEYGGAFLAWLANDSSRSPDDIDDFHEAYLGEWNSEKDFVENDICELGWGSLSAATIEENLSYIDVDFITHEMFDVGDHWSAPTPDSNVWVFRSF